MTVGPSTPPDDPAAGPAAARLPRRRRRAPAGLRVLHEPELIAAKDAAAVTLLDSLPRGGGTVRLDEATARRGSRALNDVRLALGVRLEITEDDADRRRSPTTPRARTAAMYATYRWLSAVQDSLVTALMEG